jgi:hypothetical protein
VKTNNEQILVVFKNVTHNISDYFRLTSVSIFSTLCNPIVFRNSINVFTYLITPVLESL